MTTYSRLWSAAGATAGLNNLTAASKPTALRLNGKSRPRKPRNTSIILSWNEWGTTVRILDFFMRQADAGSAGRLLFFDHHRRIVAAVCLGRSAAPFPLSEALLRSRFNLNSCALHPPCDPCAREVKPFSSRDETFFIVSAHLYSRDKKGDSYVRGVAV